MILRNGSQDTEKGLFQEMVVKIRKKNDSKKW